VGGGSSLLQRQSSVVKIKVYKMLATIFGTSATSPITVSGLTNGVSYVCAVIAINDVGAGPAAVTEPVTPVAPPPGC